MFNVIAGINNGPMPTQEFVVIDTETTGLYKNDRIIEIARVVFNREGILEEWSTLVNPSRDVGKTDLHGLTPSMLSLAPSFDQLGDDVARILNGRVLIAHNFPFDSRMLNQEFERLKMLDWISNGFCTMSAARKLLGPENVKLIKACEKLGISIQNAHSALGDARMTRKLFLEIYDNESVATNELHFDLNNPPTPTFNRSAFSKEFVDSSSEIKNFLNRVPFPTSEEKSISYLTALNMALEDLNISEFERAEIDEWADRFGIIPDRQRELHEAYFQAVISAALRDGIISEGEDEILKKIAENLGVIYDNLPVQVKKSGEISVVNLGARICFTGQAIDASGSEVPRSVLEALAAKAGFHPVSGVTKHGCDVLVASDVYSMSGKAEKAKNFGITIVSVPDFLHVVG